MKTILSIIFMTAMLACNAQNDNIKRIDAATQQEMAEQENVIVIDVRTPEEVAEGYIKGTDQFINYNDHDFDEKIAALDKSKTYIIYCRSGGRSTKACNAMVGKGFTNLYELKGGITAVVQPEYIVK